MKLTLLRNAGLSGCAVFFLLSAPPVNATPEYQPAGFAPTGLTAGFAQDRDRDWDRPSDEWNEFQRRGFHDGIEGARRDAENHRQPDVDNRDEFRHPDNVPPQMRRAYREGFRRGYERGMSHFLRGGPMAGPPPRARAWDEVPDEFDVLRRQGFHDGIEGARRDYGNHRRPDVDNRDEYRHPNLPPEQREAYREGFRRGYQVGMNHLMGNRY
jgi:hypothetical protein